MGLIKKYTASSFWLCLLLVGVPFMALIGQEQSALRFNDGGTFKIAQFTDLHWKSGSANCAKTIATIQHVLDLEQPDLVVLTGDVVVEVPAHKGWLEVADIFINAEVPWAVTLGNHDAEPDISRTQVFDLLEDLPFFMGIKGDVSGIGNYVLPINASDGAKEAALLYFFDSNAYAEDEEISNYDWIQFDQIDWYRRASQRFANKNDGLPLPALTFFHIPLPEYKHIVGAATTVGDQLEGVAAPALNSGMFASMLQMQDVMGVFVGHDHDNNYIGLHKGIALAFGQVSGYDAYGELDRGGRIIVLKEGDFSFETWIRTGREKMHHYYYPAGMPAPDPKTVFLPATKLDKVKPGIRYTYYEDKIQSTAELAGLKCLKSGYIPNISLNPAEVDDYFGFMYEGWLKIPQTGNYRFYLRSDDGSQLLIDDQLLIDNDGGHSARTRENEIALEAGFHKIKVLYFENYMGQTLEVGLTGIGIKRQALPDIFLFVE
ncbi:MULTISPECIES: PA14 domain-containing protein [unclassified Carboxylicivirga]|uniref:PA14 domain-containing protein n=1 Tax=Carboxylicivirga TaxID=1628153 RepID=UPI003D329D95